eukprot:CAMPEP_0197642642 /NCGR_PEP_ID=MMETSP1338-20131121/16239_1 /TAXON_ID=43686 ORGANISM="Pelagodinium beii, Strain RCC1491" /NCGR_SAMPLE_ID=MMETSP1338 /ASSEMBLY_ACC=CAM_ASM_000754 /LENGTH=152 /DNA_ID=CAMNT_0043215785 /DNA_START=80 /DNA_END=534 /DNA_ORIENTATION=+
MGSSISKDFKDIPDITPNQAKGNQDKRLVVVGRVSGVENVIIPPFGSNDAVAIKAQAMNEYVGGGCFRQEKQVFAGFSAVDFLIRGADGAEVYVDVTTLKSWKFHVLETHIAWAVAYDPAKGGIVSTAAGRGMYSQRDLSPEAKKWHDAFKT